MNQNWLKFKKIVENSVNLGHINFITYDIFGICMGPLSQFPAACCYQNQTWVPQAINTRPNTENACLTDLYLLQT